MSAMIPDGMADEFGSQPWKLVEICISIQDSQCLVGTKTKCSYEELVAFVYTYRCFIHPMTSGTFIHLIVQNLYP